MNLSFHVHEVEEQMWDLLASSEPALEPFYGMMAYHLGWLDRDFRPVHRRVCKGTRRAPKNSLL